MIRLTLVLYLFCGSLAASAATSQPSIPSPHAIDIPKWFTESFLDLSEDIRDAARQNKRLMVYFGQDGCPYCTALMRVNFSQQDIVAKTQQNFLSIALNLWGDREVTWIDGGKFTEKALSRFLKVQFTPTLLFFDEQGGVVLRLNGYSPPEQFRAALDYVSQRMEKQLSFTDYLASLPREKAGAARTPEPFFERGPPDLPRILKTSGKPLIVIFEQAYCRDCDELHREGFKRPDARKLLDRFSVVQLDFLGARKVVTPQGKTTSEGDWARALNVVYTPSLVFFSADGDEVFRAEGFMRPFHLAATLEYVASGGYRTEPSFQRFVQKSTDALRATGANADLWK
jgi:thioredoxin-related protein